MFTRPKAWFFFAFKRIQFTNANVQAIKKEGRSPPERKLRHSALIEQSDEGQGTGEHTRNLNDGVLE